MNAAARRVQGVYFVLLPTGVVADLRGRRLSYLLGTLTLALSDDGAGDRQGSPVPRFGTHA
jgi:hypothetical protein